MPALITKPPQVHNYQYKWFWAVLFEFLVVIGMEMLRIILVQNSHQ